MRQATLIVARHGNTFLKDEVPTRVGVRTDLPLVESEKGERIGEYLKNNDLIPDVIYTSYLLRTIQTAIFATKSMGLKEVPFIVSKKFNEIDYGVDENKAELEVCYRLGFEALNGKISGKINDKISDKINDKNLSNQDYSNQDYIDKGKEIIDLWNSDAIPPKGWLVDTNKIIDDWKSFSKEIEEKYQGKNILVVTSNGIIKFLPHITRDYKECYKKHGTKLKTGGIAIFEKDKDASYWTCKAWGV